MKVLTAALAALLLVAICYPAEAQLDTDPVICCFHYTSRRIPRSLIQNAYTVSNQCPNPAVILVTQKGKQVCVNPEAHWVKEYLNAFRH